MRFDIQILNSVIKFNNDSSFNSIILKVNSYNDFLKSLLERTLLKFSFILFSTMLSFLVELYIFLQIIFGPVDRDIDKKFSLNSNTFLHKENKLNTSTPRS